MKRKACLILALFSFLASTSAAAEIKSIYRGEVELVNYTDNTYDWGHCVIKVGDRFRMWWVRGEPHDLIYSAESGDGIHWYNTKKVIDSAKPIADVQSGNYDESDWEMMHVGSPTVVYVNSQFYMFYEAPKTIDRTTYAEVHNNIFMATSKDGINWTKYPNNTKPQPVIRMPAEVIAANPTQGYGVGQPKVMFRNGKFEIFYTSDISGSNAIYTASSNDGITWVGKSGNTDPRYHDKIFAGNTLDVKFSSKLNKYIMTFSRNNRQIKNVDMTKRFDYQVFYASSADRYDWGVTTVFDFTDISNSIVPVGTTPQTRAFPGFIANGQGIVDGETFHVMFMAGEIHLQSADWRSKCLTWDGCVTSFNPPEFASKEVQTPGKTYGTTFMNVQTSSSQIVDSKPASSQSTTNQSIQTSSVSTSSIDTVSSNNDSTSEEGRFSDETSIEQKSQTQSDLNSKNENVPDVEKGGNNSLLIILIILSVIILCGGIGLYLFKKNNMRKPNI